MTRNKKLVSDVTAAFRARRLVATPLALAMLLPVGAFAMDSTPREMFDRSGHELPLPPIRYLDAMRWMEWKPSVPVFKMDTLLLPDGTQPGVLRLPSEDATDLPRVS